MRRILICLFLIFSCSTLFAKKQGRELVDSLQRQLVSADDTQKVHLLSHICQLYAHINPDSGIIIGKEGLELARKLNTKSGIALLLNNISSSYMARSDYATAMSYCMEALKINRETGDLAGSALNMGNIGNVYYSQKNHEKAFEYYKQAFDINEKLGNKEKMATNLGNMANIYSYYSDTSQKHSAQNISNRQIAHQYYNRAINIYRELDNKAGIVRNLGNAGNLYKHDANKTQSLNLYKEALEINRDINNPVLEAAMKLNMATLYMRVAEDRTGAQRIDKYTSTDKNILIENGIALAKEAEAVTIKTGHRGILKECLATLSSLYALKGNYKLAYETEVAFSALTDSINQMDNEAAISKLESKSKLEQQEKEIEIQRLSIRQKRIVNFFMAIGIFTMLVIVRFVYRQRKKSDHLLLNILPPKIAERLKEKEHPIADQFAEVSIMFIDIVGFTQLASRHEPKDLVTMLNEVFTLFDQLAEKHGLEKIKTIGDCYMAVAGLPEERDDHAIATARMAIEAKQLIKNYKTRGNESVSFRIGLDCGPVVAGVIGTRKFTYDIWGDAVNIASRMESAGLPGEIHCTEKFREAVIANDATDNNFTFTERGAVEIKGKGILKTWLLYGIRDTI